VIELSVTIEAAFSSIFSIGIKLSTQIDYKMKLKVLVASLFLWSILINIQLSVFGNLPVKTPINVEFKTETVKRIGGYGDNWCTTWTKDGSLLTSMDDGSWLNEGYDFHHNVYKITGSKDNFIIEPVPNYPKFTDKGEGWFGYGIYSVNGIIYSMVSRTQDDRWSGPFRGIKMLKSSDNGQNWYCIARNGETRLITPMDEKSKEDISPEKMFFWEELGQFIHGKMAFPFSYCSFVEHGQDNNTARDEYLYIYSPEGAQANKLLLARVKAREIENRDRWEYFAGWQDEMPQWTKDIEKRGVVHEFPEKNGNHEYFGWYSWLPSVVWNPGLNLYIMVNGGTYGGRSLSRQTSDYYDSWMHTKTGSLGFWYSKNPYGPWTQFFYTDYWITDDEKNRTYQPKLSSKWISKDGTEMVLIWSDAMSDENGKSHTTNYRWNQMDIKIVTGN
jgi:hypothetical protein